VQGVLGNAQREAVTAERVIGVVAGNHVFGFAVALKVLLINILRHDPGRIAGLGHDGPVAHRGFPVETAESHGKSVDDLRLRMGERGRGQLALMRAVHDR